MYRRHFLTTVLLASAARADEPLKIHADEPLKVHADEPLKVHAEEPLKATAVDYTTFENKQVKLYAWRGRRMAILTKVDGLDGVLMAELCGVFDRVYDFYHEVTGRAPQRARELDGLLTVAEVDETCGAACGYLGATGIELTPGCFMDLYGGWQKGRTIDQALPYEFGRNFWFYSASLAYQSPVSDRAVVTGYAVFMRMVALEAAGAKLGPFRETSGAEFRALMEGLVDLYEADPSQTWENTLKVDAAPANPLGLNGTDLFASFCLRLARDHGGREFVQRLWRTAGQRPAATSTQEAVDNFVIAASAAAGKDLSEHFAGRWRWPVSPDGRTAAAAAATAADRAK